MKVKNRKIDLFHDNTNIVKNELVENNEIIKFLMETKWAVSHYLPAAKNNPTIRDLH